MKVVIDSGSARLIAPCPNCEQWRWERGATYDCVHECAKRGFAPAVMVKGKDSRFVFDVNKPSPQSPPSKHGGWAHRVFVDWGILPK